MKKDEAAIREMGVDGLFACWGYLQFGLHGPDAATRSVFRRLLNREFLGEDPLDKAWERSLAAYKEETRKTFRLRDVDNAAKKFFRDMKEEKK
jgi:hypothetical protein